MPSRLEHFADTARPAKPCPDSAYPGVKPAGYLPPIWRMEIQPGRYGSGAIALDPREACHVLANGCTLDEHRYRASFTGWDGHVQSDGRVTVRLDPVDEAAQAGRAFIDSARTSVPGVRPPADVAASHAFLPITAPAIGIDVPERPGPPTAKLSAPLRLLLTARLRRLRMVLATQISFRHGPPEFAGGTG